ncbi:uncharacterized protein EV422DRAFT_213854 [Fimicolochytrium jonesii]|uniref:uncharacterized protein n=1 Tax=Fimicolochytrium jonesii TaxID=1396493 RepID=UPI0022FE1534|nr:uncharacterized protein EV422DRAFT_213854 [Fimicolochytrium jonesii]KAI8817731.1 hypothetical protein EV422DRAFT_213854 [Fimicolochytrium jonesii]
MPPKRHASEEVAGGPSAKKARPAGQRGSQQAVAAAGAASNEARSKKSHHKHPNPLARKYGHHLKQQGAKEGDTAEASLAKLKKQIRDAQRTLRRPNLTATQEKELQRRVKALNLKVEEQHQRSKEEALKAKYKYLRFVEQKKCDRKIASLQKELAEVDDSEEGSDEHQQILAELRTYETNAAYVKYYPLDMKYIALFPKETTTDTPSDVKRAKILEAIRERLDKGTEPIVIREKDVFEAEGAGEQSEDEDGSSGDEGKKAGEEQEGGDDDFFLDGAEAGAEERLDIPREDYVPPPKPAPQQAPKNRKERRKLLQQQQQKEEEADA